MYGIDVGYGYTKVYPGDKAFPSVFSPWRKERLELGAADGKENLFITINGESFIVGKMALREGIPGTFDKYNFDRHKICLLTGLALAQHSYSGAVALGLPISDLRLSSEMNKLLGQYDVELNGRKMYLNIDAIITYPQAGAVYYDMTYRDSGLEVDTEMSKLKGQKAGFIDIGEKTVNFCWIENGEFVNGLSGALDIGMHSVKTRFVHLLSRQDIVIPPHAVDSYLGRISAADQEHELAVLANQIVDAISGWWNYAQLDRIYVAGGGGEKLFKYIHDRIEKTELINDPRYANARGLYKYGIVTTRNPRP